MADGLTVKGAAMDATSAVEAMKPTAQESVEMPDDMIFGSDAGRTADKVYAGLMSRRHDFR